MRRSARRRRRILWLVAWSYERTTDPEGMGSATEAARHDRRFLGWTAIPIILVIASPGGRSSAS
jgi:hypothetical protein